MIKVDNTNNSKILEDEIIKIKKHHKDKIKILIAIIGIAIFSIILMIIKITSKAKPLATKIMTNATTGMEYVAVYKKVPLLAQPLFAICIVLILAFAIFGLWYWFKFSCRNRTNVIIHMPNGKRPVYSFKNFTGSIFKIKGFDLNKDNKPIEFAYQFKAECLEDGYFGRYIEYDYGIIEPLNPKNRFREYDKNGLTEMFKFIGGLLNTDLAVDLLMSQEFKDFVKMMLIILVIIGAIILLLLGYHMYDSSTTKQVACTLIDNNVTRAVIKSAIIGK